MTSQTQSMAVIIATAFMISACGMGTHFGVEPDEFRYEPPDTVSDEHEAQCTGPARSAARQRGNELTRSKGMENTAIYGGPIGALGVFTYIYEAEEDAYEEGFEDCLEEKGYELD